jgi:lipopolysaccharide heptosyltransferase II
MYRIYNRKKRILTAIADSIGNLAVRLLNPFDVVAEIVPKKVKHILVIRTAYIGDVVMTIPMIKLLKTRFPDARISFLTSTVAAPLLKNNPDIDAVIEFNPFWFYPARMLDYLTFIRRLKHRRFDLVIEARGDIREILLLVLPLDARYKLSYAVGGGAFALTHVVAHPQVNHRVDYHLDMAAFLGAQVDRTHLDWGIHLTPEEKVHVDKILEKEGVHQPFWCAHPGSRLPLKRWMNDRYAAAFDHISEKIRCPLVLLGTYSELADVKEIADRLKHRPYILAGKINLREMLGIIQKASLFVCNDSAPMHIAAAVQVPTVAIFGPSKSMQTGPRSPVAIVVEKPFICRAHCDEKTCTNNIFYECMKSIAVKDVVDSALELWQRTSGRR